MKLSEAIMLGSVGSQQGFGVSSILTESPRKCALGAALLAEGIEVMNGELGIHQATIKWPWTSTLIHIPSDLERFDFVDSLGPYINIYTIIWRLNDQAHWTRPQIAAYVAELEKIYDKDSTQQITQPLGTLYEAI